MRVTSKPANEDSMQDKIFYSFPSNEINKGFEPRIRMQSA